MIYAINTDSNYFMQMHLFDDQYVYLAWPKNTPLKWLDFAKEVVNLQLDQFRERAKRDEPRKEYARIEVESWSKQEPFPDPFDYSLGISRQT